MRHTSFHSAFVTGCTERRIEVTRLILASFRLPFTSASVTGFGSLVFGLTATAFGSYRPILGVVSLAVAYAYNRRANA